MIAYIDGSFNPKTEIYGFGVYFKELNLCANGRGILPNFAVMRNVAGEILGAKAAVRKALSLEEKNLTLYYDYADIEHWVTGAWQAKKPETQEYRDFMRNCGLDISFKKVKAHTGDRGNEIADILAKHSVGIALTGPQYKLVKDICGITLL